MLKVEGLPLAVSLKDLRMSSVVIREPVDGKQVVHVNLMSVADGSVGSIEQELPEDAVVGMTEERFNRGR